MLRREIILLSPLKFTEQTDTCEAWRAGGVSAGAQSPPGAVDADAHGDTSGL